MNICATLYSDIVFAKKSILSGYVSDNVYIKMTLELSPGFKKQCEEESQQTLQALLNIIFMMM